MRKLRPILKISLSVIFGIIFIASFTLYSFLSNRWRKMFTDEQMQAYAKIVNRTPDLPNNICTIYDKIYPGKRQMTMNKELFGIVSNVLGFKDQFEDRNSPYRRIYIHLCPPYSKYRDNISQPKYIDYFIGWGFQEYCLPEKAFAYDFVNMYEYFRRQKNITIFHKNIFSKHLTQLSGDEILELLIVFESPSVDKIRQSERFERRLKEFRDLMNKKTEISKP